jgi:hypothetical protein
MYIKKPSAADRIFVLCAFRYNYEHMYVGVSSMVDFQHVGDIFVISLKRQDSIVRLISVDHCRRTDT